VEQEMVVREYYIMQGYHILGKISFQAGTLSHTIDIA
jgi:hypothetical protein